VWEGQFSPRKKVGNSKDKPFKMAPKVSHMEGVTCCYFFHKSYTTEWSEAESERAKFDWMAKNIITFTLSCDVFFRVSQCSFAKEMWDILEVTHESTNYVKRVRKHALIQEYELFRMSKGESICDVQKSFSHIVNQLMSLGKTFDKEELNIKILKCLDRTWQPKVTAISESKDLTSMSVASLFGKLRDHELEINRLLSKKVRTRTTRA